jgi:hypothetical protein
MKDFIIPVHPEDLLIAGDRYSVKPVQDIDSLSESTLRSKLSGRKNNSCITLSKYAFFSHVIIKQILLISLRLNLKVFLLNAKHLILYFHVSRTYNTITSSQQYKNLSQQKKLLNLFKYNTQKRK